MSGHLTDGSGEDGFGVQGSGSGVEGSGSGVEGSGSSVDGSGSGVEGWISESEELRGLYRLYSSSSRRGAIDSDSDRSLETLKRVLLIYFNVLN